MTEPARFPLQAGLGDLFTVFATLKHVLNRTRPAPEDSRELALAKLVEAHDAGEKLHGASMQILDGLGVSRRLAVLARFDRDYMDKPQARVFLGHGEKTVTYSPELYEQLQVDERPKIGLHLLLDPQETTIVEVVEDDAVRGLKLMKVVRLRKDDHGQLVVDAEGLHPGAPRDECALAYTCFGKETEIAEGDLVWGRDNLVYRHEKDDGEESSSKRFRFEGGQVLPDSIVGRRQKRVMAGLLKWAKLKLSGKGTALARRMAVLLVGMPGNGKTEIVRAFVRGIRKKYPDQVYALAMSASDAFNEYVGVTERNFREFISSLNEMAKSGMVCVGVIEEIDTAAGDRRSLRQLDGGVEKRVVSTLLNCLDGLAELHPGVLLVFSSNVPRDGLDPAVKRRVKILDIPKLNWEELKELMKRRVCENLEYFAGDDWEEFADLVEEGLKTEVGSVLCGKDPVSIRAHDCLTGAAVRDAYEEALELYDWRLDMVTEPLVTPEELARQIPRQAAVILDNMTVEDVRDAFTRSGLIPRDKAREVVDLPALCWHDSGEDEVDDEMVDELLKEFS